MIPYRAARLRKAGDRAAAWTGQAKDVITPSVDCFPIEGGRDAKSARRSRVGRRLVVPGSE
jgi:hypothetical protein